MATAKYLGKRLITKRLIKQASTRKIIVSSIPASYDNRAEERARINANIPTAQQLPPSISNASQAWLDTLGGGIVREYHIPGTLYTVDGFDPHTNTVYEFHGDYWHGNPKVFSPSQKNNVNGETFGFLYQKTIDRDDHIRKLGYHLIIMWEREWQQLTFDRI